jgi:Domain of unknown function (DUF397)
MQSAWRRASFCQSRECIEVGQRNGVVLIRDSVQPHGGVLESPARDWQSLLRRVKAGELDYLGS